MPIYLTLQLIRCAACNVTIAPGGLLPRLFTLTSTKGGGGYFLSHYSTITDSFPLRNMILCVARTFLTQHIELRATRHATAIIIPIYLQRYAHFHNFLLLSDKTFLSRAEKIRAGTYCRSQPFLVTLLLPRNKQPWAKVIILADSRSIVR